MILRAQILKQIMIWGQTVPQIKKLKKTAPILKNGDLFPSTFWSEALFGLKSLFIVAQQFHK